MHLLQSGVDLNMIRSWLGHASIETTNLYIEIDLEMKQKTFSPVKNCYRKPGRKGPSWRRDPSILEWLKTYSYVKRLEGPACCRPFHDAVIAA